MRQKSPCGSVWVHYEIIKLNRLENKVSFSNKCNEVSLDIDFFKRDDMVENDGVNES